MCPGTIRTSLRPSRASVEVVDQDAVTVRFEVCMWSRLMSDPGPDFGQSKCVIITLIPQSGSVQNDPPDTALTARIRTGRSHRRTTPAIGVTR